ncbi:YbhB/YbcL family Raf kinase inhibitor-like protein [Actinospica durhamensis]|uniref:YbhB/YbcL family Raf kinase inhibitor-like protein n=1 Tax=Actinospica durhamensis TaxID=1508375 RepID=A0A941IMX6_9ACTN|nr:YbhB/YbcL family Raf kinase inhibitor-like protein [Actinospica durhamensis]MBR7833339.1 YbhB/YbcL family Raf kinase inhibitor-like protein [Actinospica durhamensis]
MKKSTRSEKSAFASSKRALLIAGAGSALAVGTVTASASAAPAGPGTRAASAKSAASSNDGGYGYTVVRSGIPDDATHFTVSSPQIRDGAFPASAWADAFGCSGANQQFTLDWHGAPADAKSFAVTMYDPDAPTGSGFWHWLEWDIPSHSSQLTSTAPAGAVVGTDDAGVTGYLGPCPPAGDIAHHYTITVYALDVASLDLPASTPAAVTVFTMSSHIVGYARMVVDASR